MSWTDVGIAGLIVPLHAMLTLRQSYEAIGGFELLRLWDGAARAQQHWERVRTRIQATGWQDPGIFPLSHTTTYTLKCAVARAVLSAGNVVALPAARRADKAPWAFAHVGGQRVNTPVAVAGDTATCTAVAGATAYAVHYYPELSVKVLDWQCESNADRAEWAWSLTAETI